MELTHLSLFSGIGGLDLAAEWAGFKTVGQCEFADYPTKVLEKHWPDVPRWRDIRTLTGESFYERTGLRTVDIVSGGFPCQPFSVAGRQAGKKDDRYLWPEMLRVIRELTPRWVLGENVPGIIKIAGRTVCEDLEREGYAVTVFDFEAAAVGAPHRRERVFFVADSDAERKSQPQGPDKIFGGRPSDSGEDVAYTDEQGLQRWECRELQKCSDERITGEGGASVSDAEGEQAGRVCLGGVSTDAGASGDGARETSWWAVEPDVGRVANGIPSRVDRLKCLGNAVVPQQAYPMFKAIYDVETGFIL